MRSARKEKQKEEKFWQRFIAINVPDYNGSIPKHLRRVNFRLEGADDDSLRYMAGVVKSIGQLDLDECDITAAGIQYLMQLSIKELRLKGCVDVGDDSMDYLTQLSELELLHLGGTAVSLDGFKDIVKLTHLKLLLISASDPTAEALADIAVQLPAGCEFVVNHRVYDL